MKPKQMLPVRNHDYIQILKTFFVVEKKNYTQRNITHRVYFFKNDKIQYLPVIFWASINQYSIAQQDTLYKHGLRPISFAIIKTTHKYINILYYYTNFKLWYYKMLVSDFFATKLAIKTRVLSRVSEGAGEGHCSSLDFES